MRRTHKAAYSAMVLIAFLSLFEGAARVKEMWRPPVEVDYGLGFYGDLDVFVPVDDQRWQTRPSKTETFLPQRISMPKPAGTVRIALVGGSSVNRLEPLHDDLAGQIAQLGGFEAVDLVNLGGNSYGTGRLRTALAGTLALEPDVVVIYSGHNEEQEQITFRRLISDAPSPVNAALASRSAGFRLLRDRINAVREAWVERWPGLAGGRAPEEWSHPRDATVAVYEENLRAMIAMSHSAGASVLLGVPSGNLLRPDLPRADKEALETVYDRDGWEDGMQAALLALEALPDRAQVTPWEILALRQVAADTGVRLVDVDAAVRSAEPHGVPGETLFQDHCHLNDAGNRLWVSVMAPAIAQVAAEHLAQQR